MRTHDDESQRTASPPSPAAHRHDPGAILAQRALADGRPTAVDPAAIAHLQRAAGNTSVSSMLGEEDRSPVLDVVSSRRGSPLDSATRSEMEGSFGHDFGDVRIHTGSEAATSARSVQAQAYTVGDDIVLGEGAPAPDTAAGKRTLAHELAHVVQQRSGPVDGTDTGGGVALSHPSDRFEQAAEATADQVVGGSSAVGTGHARGEVVQRSTEGEPEAAPVAAIQRQEAPEEEEPEEAPG